MRWLAIIPLSFLLLISLPKTSAFAQTGTPFRRTIVLTRYAEVPYGSEEYHPTFYANRRDIIYMQAGTWSDSYYYGYSICRTSVCGVALFTITEGSATTFTPGSGANFGSTNANLLDYDSRVVTAVTQSWAWQRIWIIALLEQPFVKGSALAVFALSASSLMVRMVYRIIADWQRKKVGGELGDSIAGGDSITDMRYDDVDEDVIKDRKGE